MSKITRALMTTAALAVFPTIAVAADDGMWGGENAHWYVGVGMGANWLDDLDGNAVFPGPVNVPVTAEFDTGWAAIGSIGYAWDNWRLEFELGYRDMTTEHMHFGAFTGTAFMDVSEFSQMLNLIWDIPLGDRMALSLGAGAGGALLNFEGGGFTGGGGALALDDDDYVFAYQGIAGLSYDISDAMELFAEYRFFGVDEFRARGTVTPFAAPVFMADNDIENHTGLLGVRYHFGVEPQAPPPQPVEQAPPAQAPRTFIVFFDFNKSNLTAEAQNVVAEAADSFKQTGSVRLKVTGHTDTVGSASYNQRLSERRAASVTAELVRLGVPENAIATEGRGFNDLMVPTGPGVREPQNRRAVIDLGG